MMSASTGKFMKISTPELLWHGGGNEHGKPDPIYSLDYHPTESVMLTTGIDASVPPKGSVRLWKIDPIEDKQDFLIDFSDHQDVANIARFSPCGRMIASASDKQIVVYTVHATYQWESVTEMKQVERTWIRPNVNELFDLEWSPDSSYLVVASISGKAEVIRIADKHSLTLPGHTSYVQGVTWDPLNKMIATQSSDRSCKVHMIKYKENVMLKLASRGHVILKMNSAYQSPNPEENEKKEGEETPAGQSSKAQGLNLFADSNVPSFFRRLTFTPDGALLIIPTGIHRNPLVAQQPSGNSKKNANNNTNPLARSFCTHIYHREQLLNGSAPMPALSLVGLDEPSVAVRVCPRLFKFIGNAGDDVSSNSIRPLFAGNYRMVFAVVTISSVFIYDTQHPYPLVKLSGLHYAAINDAAWTGDGNVLSFCSSDGYVSFVRFANGALGEMLDIESVPEDVKKSHPRLYNYIPPAGTVPSEATSIGNNVKDYPQDELVAFKVDDKDDNNKDDGATIEDSNKPELDIIGTSPRKPSPLEVFNRSQVDEQPLLELKALQKIVASPSDQMKKKKRIQPTVVASLPAMAAPNSSSSASANVAHIDLTHHSGVPAVISLVEDSHDFALDAPNHVEVLPPLEPTLRDPIMESPPTSPAVTNVEPTSSANQAAEPPSKKKRIAPTLVSTLK